MRLPAASDTACAAEDDETDPDMEAAAQAIRPLASSTYEDTSGGGVDGQQGKEGTCSNSTQARAKACRIAAFAAQGGGENRATARELRHPIPARETLPTGSLRRRRTSRTLRRARATTPTSLCLRSRRAPTNQFDTPRNQREGEGGKCKKAYAATQPCHDADLTCHDTDPTVRFSLLWSRGAGSVGVSSGAASFDRKRSS